MSADINMQFIVNNISKMTSNVLLQIYIIVKDNVPTAIAENKQKYNILLNEILDKNPNIITKIYSLIHSELQILKTPII